MSTAQTASAPVLAVLDDTASGPALLEVSGTLARLLQRELTVVYVESTRALGAAALSVTQVLPHAAAAWQPLATHDVEQGFRAQAAQLRALTARIALRDALHWSLQVMRGTLDDAMTQLSARTDLLLTAPSMSLATGFATTRRTAHRRPVVVVLVDDSAAGRRARELAQQLATALQGSVQVIAASLAKTPQARESWMRADVLVMPRTDSAHAMGTPVRCPMVLVG